MNYELFLRVFVFSLITFAFLQTVHAPSLLRSELDGKLQRFAVEFSLKGLLNLAQGKQSVTLG